MKLRRSYRYRSGTGVSNLLLFYFIIRFIEGFATVLAYLGVWLFRGLFWLVAQLWGIVYATVVLGKEKWNNAQAAKQERDKIEEEKRKRAEYDTYANRHK